MKATVLVALFLLVPTAQGAGEYRALIPNPEDLDAIAWDGPSNGTFQQVTYQNQTAWVAITDEPAAVAIHFASSAPGAPPNMTAWAYTRLADLHPELVQAIGSLHARQTTLEQRITQVAADMQGLRGLINDTSASLTARIQDARTELAHLAKETNATGVGLTSMEEHVTTHATASTGVDGSILRAIGDLRDDVSEAQQEQALAAGGNGLSLPLLAFQGIMAVAIGVLLWRSFSKGEGRPLHQDPADEPSGETTRKRVEPPKENPIGALVEQVRKANEVKVNRMNEKERIITKEATA